MGLRIGELARRTGVGVSTLRAWESRFRFLEPERSPAGQRLYVDSDVDRPHRLEPTRLDAEPRLTLNLRSGEIAAIVWATGFRPDYSWLHVPVLDRRGRLRHDGGVVTGAPGMYAIGLNLLRRRKSSFIHGAEDDARELTDHLAAHLGAPAAGR